LGSVDRPHVGLESLLPPPHGFPKRKVHLLQRTGNNVRAAQTKAKINIETNHGQCGNFMAIGLTALAISPRQKETIIILNQKK
jgi:hypothetical protein